MQGDPPIGIRAVGLTKRYRSGDKELSVFDGLTFSIEPGERIAIIGESGAGKSTLLHLLGGLDHPTSGEIFFGDTEISRLNEAALADFRNRQLGFVWQIHYLLPEFTAEENVMMPLLIRGVSRANARTSALERLSEVGLEQRAHHRAGELSGGEQQRVVLARALVNNPKVLMADEPTGNLDYRTGEKIADLLDEVHRRHQLTSIFVTHNFRFAQRCDRIYHLEKGFLEKADKAWPDIASPWPLQAVGQCETSAREDGIDHV